jgi:starch synthase
MVSSEAVPFAKTGGLADAVRSLADALENLGQKIRLVLPSYRSAKKVPMPLLKKEKRLEVPLGRRMLEAGLLEARVSENLRVLLIDTDPYFDREELYGTPQGDYPDNAERFAFFARAALEALKDDPPSILHIHDWHPALALAFLRADSGRYPELLSTKTLITVHNLGYQGIFPQEAWPLLNLERQWFQPEFFEFYGRLNYLKAGLMFADRITTVSQSYAKEIQTPDLGFGLDGVLRKRADRLSGILNGAGYNLWDPKIDPFIKAPFDAKDPSGKMACKRDLQETLGLPVSSDTPLLGMVSRLVRQKGIDLLLQAIEPIAQRGLQLVILGKGEALFEESLSAASKAQGNIRVHIAFDEALAHKIIASSDGVLIPSRYEPSGLVQMHAMRYGTLPIARATGGLKDTIIPYKPGSRKATGFLFEDEDVSSLLGAVDEAIQAYKRKTPWHQMMQNAMKANFSWMNTAEGYLDLYRVLLEG